jgi:hypothetical protein
MEFITENNLVRYLHYPNHIYVIKNVFHKSGYCVIENLVWEYRMTSSFNLLRKINTRP